MIIEKITLKVGKKKIELTESEYNELKAHFTDKEWVPYPVYPQPQPVLPIGPYQPLPIWYTACVSADTVEVTTTSTSAVLS